MESTAASFARIEENSNVNGMASSGGGNKSQTEGITFIDSPTQVESLEIKPSESQESEISAGANYCVLPTRRDEDTNSMRLTDQTKEDVSTIPWHDQIIQEQEEAAPDSNPPPSFHHNSSTNASRLILSHFSLRATQIMDQFESKINGRVDALAKKIDDLEHKIRLQKSKRRLDLVLMMEGEDEKRSRYS